MFTGQALVLLVFLRPGFLSMAILDMLIPPAKRDVIQKIINALILSLIIYGIYSLKFTDYPIAMVAKTVGDIKHIELRILHWPILWLVGIALTLSMVVGGFQKRDLHMKALRKMKVTDRTSRRNVWYDVFTDVKSYVIINFEDGRRILGWPEYYSDDPEDQTIFLCDAAWIQENGDLTHLDNRGILITRNHKANSIEFCRLSQP